MIREPLDGKKCVIPIEDRQSKSWLCSPKTLVGNLLLTLRLPADSVPPHIRQINVPGICVTVQGMMDALEAVGGADKVGSAHREGELYTGPDSQIMADAV
ncbi:unnamed protein product [Penicillium nalgiovense]|uniref:Uncharacterized protein n=1 Tax=Penicillium thymicola TaxID=293382 RepID=A0AAI9X245_PENTH|nr:hypothetical protein VN97_g12593 [Penicillium thymicola]CAG8053842.1 unnamed protein product [Penicillium nalgiovense]CAG8083441.1 unnamed protein product [Penicillium nalgiovense]CAG8094791.1 unnamed protein product [Penicillium nalgiovense]CAG8194228.1 unnamed protein product [Penicillium nalgiovense]